MHSYILVIEVKVPDDGAAREWSRDITAMVNASGSSAHTLSVSPKCTCDTDNPCRVHFGGK